MQKVLIIDDDQDWREGNLKTALLPLGCNITTIGEYSEALQRIQQETYDVTVLNIELDPNEQNSVRVTQKWTGLLDLIKQRESEVIVVTSQSPRTSVEPSELVRIAFKDFEVVDYLFKEKFNPKEYRETIQDALSKNRLDSQGSAPTQSNIVTSPSSSIEETRNSTTRHSRGVFDDVFFGLEEYFPDFDFNELYTKLALSTEDRKIYYAVEMWDELWLQEPGLPYLPLIGKLAEQEQSGEMHAEYRDHVVHSLWTYFLGLYLYHNNNSIKQSMDAYFQEEDFYKAWKIAALFHDIGYTGDKGIDQEANLLKPLLNELQAFIDHPIHEYLKARDFKLSVKDDNKLRKISNRFTIVELTLDDLELVPLPESEEKLLDRIEDLVVSTSLAQQGQNTPIRNYYQLGKTVKPEVRSRYRDHGVLSGLILLHQFFYFDYCLRELQGKSLPSRLDRRSCEKLKELIEEPVTHGYEKIVCEAAAAISLHNINVDIWNIEQTKREPYYLSLEDYNIKLDKNPLAFLLAVTDVLQCWDRPKRSRFVDDRKDFSVRGQDVRIRCENGIILWSVRQDKDASQQLVSPKHELETMSKYLSCCGGKDLSLLIRECEWPE